MPSLSDFFALQNYNLTHSQAELLKKLEKFIDLPNCEKNTFLLKGYAGTGKTFITKGLTEYLKNIRRSYVLAAPTGKAAKVIANKTKSEAFTIHKTIYSRHNIKEYKDEKEQTIKFYFELNVNDISHDTIYIIDEASMISNVYNEMEFMRFGSGFLLKDLIHFINLDCNDHKKKIIFIGDNAQLPPVGMNFSPALDINYLINNFGLLCDEYELTEVVRQKSESGILKNTEQLRAALKTKIYNKLDINTNYDDVEHLEHSDFINKYLQECNYKIDHQTMLIAYTNVSVKEYNDKIREKFFPNYPQNITVGDKIIVTQNNANYEIFISNGDFGMIEEISPKTEIRHSSKYNLDLLFRNAVILFYDINSGAHHIKCKIIENILYSAEPSLSSDETKALYVDFMIRHPGLKANTKEWKELLLSDPYFNALRVKFGYAITCHKAQGSEWKRVFIDCKSHLSKLSQEYFRWFYTAITRSSEKLFTLDEPHISPFSKLNKVRSARKVTILEEQKYNIPQENLNFFENSSILNKELDEPKNIEEAIFQKVKQTLSSINTQTKNVENNQFGQVYTVEDETGESRFKLSYNSKNMITDISMIRGSNSIENVLKKLVNQIIFFGDFEDEIEFEFPEEFLKDYYNLLLENCSKSNIQIIDIEHLPYMERYTFKQNDKAAIIDFNFNAKGQFTRTQMQKGSDINLFNFIKSLLK